MGDVEDSWVCRFGGLGTTGLKTLRGGPMVNEPQVPVPHQHVGVVRRAIHVGHIGIKLDDRRGERRFGGLSNRVKHHGTRQVIEPQIETGAGSDEIL